MPILKTCLIETVVEEAEPERQGSKIEGCCSIATSYRTQDRKRHVSKTSARMALV